jgi:hypothetical protein
VDTSITHRLGQLVSVKCVVLLFLCARNNHLAAVLPEFPHNLASLLIARTHDAANPASS